MEYYDRDMPGFALRASCSATKSFVLMTRVPGKLTRLTLGAWPTMTLADAHLAAREARVAAKAGEDPREQKRQQQNAAADARKVIFGTATDQFMERHARTRLKPRTIEAYMSALKGPRMSAWQDKPIFAITRGHVMQLLDGLESAGKHASAKLPVAHTKGPEV